MITKGNNYRYNYDDNDDMFNIRIPDYIFSGNKYSPVRILDDYSCCSENSGTSWGSGLKTLYIPDSV